MYFLWLISSSKSSRPKNYWLWRDDSRLCTWGEGFTTWLALLSILPSCTPIWWVQYPRYVLIKSQEIFFVLELPSKKWFLSVEHLHKRDLVITVFGNSFSLLKCKSAAIAILWIEFVREVRLFWNEGDILPRMALDAPPDPGACLIHQKLQLVWKLNPISIVLSNISFRPCVFHIF